MLDAHSVPLSAGELNFQPNFQKGGDLKGSLLLEGGYWKRGGVIFLRGGGAIFTQKNKLKSEIFYDKKSL